MTLINRFIEVLVLSAILRVDMHKTLIGITKSAANFVRYQVSAGELADSHQVPARAGERLFVFNIPSLHALPANG